MIRNPRMPRLRHSGFSLVEMSLSMVILAALLLGAQSAVMIAARAVPTPTSQSSQAISAAEALDMLLNDARYAISFSVMSERAVEFNVPDRNNDGQPETIRYHWQGSPGDPLLRTVNQAAAVTLLASVNDFALDYQVRATPGSATSVEDAETMLAGQESSSSLNDRSVKSDQWVAQHFSPSLPQDAASWRVTRAWVRVRIKGNTQGITKVQLRPAINNRPGSLVVGEFLLYENTLTSSFAWREIPFTQSIQLAPNSPMCLVLQWAQEQDACEVQFHDNLLFGEGADCMLLGSGSSWNLTNDVLQYYIAGRITRMQPGAPTYRLDVLQCTLAMTSRPSSRLTSSVRIVNQPPVAAP